MATSRLPLSFSFLPLAFRGIKITSDEKAEYTPFVKITIVAGGMLKGCVITRKGDSWIPFFHLDALGSIALLPVLLLDQENFAKATLTNLLLNKVALLVKVVRGEGLHVVKMYWDVRFDCTTTMAWSALSWHYLDQIRNLCRFQAYAWA